MKINLCYWLLPLIVHNITSVDIEGAIETIELYPNLLLQHLGSLLSIWEKTQPI